MYDENRHPYLLVFIIASTLAVCVGAWFYFRQTVFIQRVLSLVAGLISLAAIGGINSATWDWRAYYNLPENAHEFSLIGVAFYALIFAGICLIGYLAQKRQKKAR
jgi:asparagine N-glycosylation enzyme membrane subunit Stt3